MKRRVAVLVFAVVAATGLCLAPAAAAEHHRGRRVLVVDNDTDRSRCRTGREPFTTIQSAVDAARPGDTIRVCPGLYVETVEVDKQRLTILGAKAGQDARRRGRWGESIVTGDDPNARAVVQLLEDRITWDGFVIRGEFGQLSSPGMYTSPDHSGYSVRNTIFHDNGLGLHLGSNGKRSSRVHHNRFIANNEFNGPGAGNGIYSDEGAKDVRITENRFERHNGAGILFADRTDTDGAEKIVQEDIRVERNQSVQDRSFAAFYASSRVCLTRNVATANLQVVPPFSKVSAIFIGARNHQVIVHANRILAASGNGIDITDSGAGGLPPAAPTEVTVLGNKVTNAQEFGIDVLAPGADQFELRSNRAVGNKIGIHLGPETERVLVRGNAALDNDEWDCQDLSGGTAAPKNLWRRNVGVTADPAGICNPPVERPRDRPRHDGDDKKFRHDPCRCGLPRRF